MSSRGTFAVANAPEAAPWLPFVMAFAATSTVIGVIWDISWHSTIGRDTFWTPAHMAIYLGGVLAGCACGYLALRVTYGPDSRGRGSTVRFWGFHAPLGAWIAIWGAIAMLTSAPFDDWWHNAYGLDVEILSPPHTVLLLGMASIIFGAILISVSLQNRGMGISKIGNLTFVYSSGTLLALVHVMATEFRVTNQQHSSSFYWIASFVYPLILVACARASRVRWPATKIALVYMLINLAMIWILPLFRAQPLLAPIFNPVERMVVDVWPLLLVIPALAIDWTLARWKNKSPWMLALPMALAFVSLLGLSQWYFSAFLLTDAAHNWFFAANNTWSYGALLGSWTQEFWNSDVDWKTWPIAIALAYVSMRLALGWGRWMRKVQR